MQNTLFDKTFRDENGQIVIAQTPNLPIISWTIVTLLRLIFNSGKIALTLEAIGFGLLFTWAWGEIFQGVNYFRRGLGAVVLIVAIAERISGF